MFDLTLQQILFRILALLFIVAIHGFALAGIARLLGARGPGYDGKLSVSPLVHLDMIAVVATIFSRVGWVRPIDIDPGELRFGRAGLVVCALGALSASVLAGVLLYRLRTLAIVSLPDSLALGTVVWIRVATETSFVFVVANLLPLPPFTGGYVLQAVAPGVAARLRALYLPIALVIAALCVAGVATRPMASAAAFLSARLLS